MEKYVYHFLYSVNFYCGRRSNNQIYHWCSTKLGCCNYCDTLVYLHLWVKCLHLNCCIYLNYRLLEWDTYLNTICI